MEALEAELKETLGRSVSRLPVVKDLPRLAPRTTVEVVSPAMRSVTTSFGTDDDGSAASAAVESTIRLLTALAGQLEPHSGSERLAAYFSRAAATTATTEAAANNAELIVREAVFDALGGDASPTARLLKAITQSVVAHGLWALRQRLGDAVSDTKDCSAKEGWRVAVLFAQEGCVAVTHTRREVAALPEKCGGEWWFEWQLRMVFGREVSELQSCRMRITGLWFSDTVDPSFRATIDRALGHGHLILS